MFSKFAPFYWERGLPAIPLRVAQKMPALNAWQTFAQSMPTSEEQAAWLERYPDGNIGLPLGPQAGIVGLDVDNDDPRVLAILDAILPPSPWKRVGKKGFVAAFKYNGERTYRIKDEEGKTILELLSRGAQIVLPPSIHPDTQRPYESNTNLYEVVDQLNPLPAQFETMIRQALIDAGFKLTSRGSNKVTEWVPSGGRDSAMTAMAGLIARSVLRAERSLMEALAEMEAWVASYTEKVVGDTLDPTKARGKVMEFVRRDITEHGRGLPQGWDAGMPTEDLNEVKKYLGQDYEEWTLSRLLDFLTEQFIAIPADDIAGRGAVIDQVMMRLSKAEHLTSLEHNTILQFIVNANGRMISLSTLRKRVQELKVKELQGTDHTEIAQALISEIERYGELRYQGSYFYQWRGSHWQQMEEVELMKVLAENFGKLQAARKHNDHKGIIKTAASLVPKGVKTINVPGINFANGYLTQDIQLLPHEPKYGAEYTLPYRFAPNEGAPLRFLSFLDQCWGEDVDYVEKVQALRQAMAATMFGQAARYQRAFCLFGPPQSGKSTTADIMQLLLPSHTRCTVPPHKWDDKFMPTQMHGKLLNFAGELSETSMISGDIFKLIVEGSEIAGQLKGKDIFNFRTTCAQWFSSNHLPRTRDSSAGFNRRWLILTFNNPRKDTELQRNLAEDIVADEREAIAAWAVVGMTDLLETANYTLPESHCKMINELAATNNSVRFFITAGGLKVHVPSEAVDGANHISEKKLYGLYYAFCRIETHASPVAQLRFRAAMQELQYEMGFKVQVDVTPNGEVVNYIGLTLADRKVS